MRVVTILGACGAAAAAVLVAGPARAQPIPAPYVAVHDPQFIGAAEATFLNDGDRVIGVMTGKIAKAFPAAILIQHGLVEDASPNGPIAITW